MKFHCLTDEQALNFISPTFQDTIPGFRSPLNIRTSSPIWQYLAKHYKDKHELYLTYDVAERIYAQFKPQFDRDHTSKTPGRRRVRELYAKVLGSYGQKPVVGSYRPDDQKKAIALTAIIQQANEDGLISGPSANGRYELIEGCIDWERTSHRVQRLAPEADMSNYTPTMFELLLRRSKDTALRFGRLTLGELLMGQNFHKVLSRWFPGPVGELFSSPHF